MKKLLVVLVMLAGISAASATVLTSDNFTYSNGNIVGQGSWGSHSGAGATPVQVSNGIITLSQGSGSREDINKNFGDYSGTLYAGFDITVSGGNSSVYFAHFIQGTSTSFENRIGVTAPTGSGDFTFGIFSASTTVASSFASGFNYNQVYRLVAAYDYATHVSTLWVINPVNGSSNSVSFTETYNNICSGFAFRQAAGNSSEKIDNLIVATTYNEAAAIPEPATMALLGLGSLIFIRRK